MTRPEARPNRGGPPGPQRRHATQQADDATGIKRYLLALFERDEPGALIEVRYRYGDGMRSAFFEHTDTTAAARTIVRLASGTDVYVGVAPRVRRAGGRDAIERVWSLWADLDDADAATALDDLPVAPAIRIASGSPGHLHAYWPLQQPIGVLEAEAANRRLAAELGADGGAVTNAATILRPPGTNSHKTTPPRPVVLVRLHEAMTTVHAVTAGIARDPAPARAAPTLTTTARRGQDPLRALDPALYVEVLIGQRVGRSRKVSCPFHEDRTPSLHVYEAPEDGWYCFGCKRHGHTAYDLASAIWHLDTRGADFVALRQRLLELFLPEQPHTPSASDFAPTRRTRPASRSPPTTRI